MLRVSPGRADEQRHCPHAGGDEHAQVQPGPQLVALHELVGIAVGEKEWAPVARSAHHVDAGLDSHLAVLGIDLALGGGDRPLPLS